MIFKEDIHINACFKDEHGRLGIVKDFNTKKKTVLLETQDSMIKTSFADISYVDLGAVMITCLGFHLVNRDEKQNNIKGWAKDEFDLLLLPCYNPNRESWQAYVGFRSGDNLNTKLSDYYRVPLDRTRYTHQFQLLFYTLTETQLDFSWDLYRKTPTGWKTTC